MSSVRGRRRGTRGRGRGRAPVYAPRVPVYTAVDTREGSVSSDVSSLSDLTSLDYERLNVSKESAPIKRLYKEYVEVRKNPLPNISVVPLPKDFFEWHGNIRAPSDTLYDGGIFHFAIRFSYDHPNTPPTLVMKSRIEHPCVHNGLIKLDTLVDHAVKGISPEKRYYYYSPGYTVQSILIQLHTILYEGTVEIALEDLKEVGMYTAKKKQFIAGVEFSVEQSLRYSCEQCKHRPKNYYPPLPELDSVPPPVTTEDSIYSDYLVCYQTRKTHEEAPLGLGISFSKNVRTGRLQSVVCASDVISLNAYKGQNVREMWQHQFTHWIPLYLAKSNPERASYLAKRTLSSIYRGSPIEFQSTMALDFFPKLLTHLTLSFITEKWYAAALRILRAYCYIHRLFLHFLQNDHELVKLAKEKVQQFIDNPDMRSKEHVPQLGELLCLLSTSGYTWEDIRELYLEESLARGVLWIIKKHPELDTDKPDAKVDAGRLSKSFAVNQVGMQFLLAQNNFNQHFTAPATARSTRSTRSTSNIDLAASLYDKHWSLVPWRITDQVWEDRKRILNIDSYKGFYAEIGLPEPSDEEMLETLRKAVKMSRDKHYTGDKGIVVLSPEEFEKERLGKIKSLEECIVDGSLHDDELQWKEMYETRFGLSELPDSYGAVKTDYPWKHLFLQQNLQELVGKLNDNPDFPLLYRTLELSADVLTCYELVTFDPDNIKSGHFFLTRILEKLPKLNHLTIVKGEKGLGEKGFKDLVKGIANSSGALSVLDMGHSEITTPCVKQLAETHLTSEGLKVLNLEGNPLLAAGSQSLGKLMMKHHSLPNLEELNLRRCKIPDAGITALADGLIVKRNIKKLNLSENLYGSLGLSLVVHSLAYNPVLEELSLTKMSISSNLTQVEEALTFLFSLTVSLKKINFWSTLISPYFNKQAMEKLAENTTLEELDLGSTSFGKMDEFHRVFASKKTKLRTLIAEESIMTYKDVQTVNKAMEDRACSLREVNFRRSKSLFQRWFDAKAPNEKEQKKTLVKFFSQTLANVTHLNFSDCNIDTYGAEVLGQVLKQDTALVHLDLSFNCLHKMGMKQIAAGLMENKKLKYLRLDHCHLRAAGAHYLAQVLGKPECVLQELHVFCNYFEVPGVSAVCEALCSNRHLQVIDLGMNKVRKNGAAAVVKMLEANKSLTRIALKFNYIPDVWALKIARTVVETRGCSVTEVKLAGNSLQYATLINIESMLKECPREIHFDLAERAVYLDPEKLERTVYVNPLAANVTKEMVKKLFYSNNCGAITSVQLNMRPKKKGKKANFAKAQYAFVEFAHKDSVELAMDLVHKDKAYIRGSYQKLSVVRAGLGKSAAVKGIANPAD